MISCEQVLESLWDYLDSEGTPDGLAEIRDHLSLCRVCFSRVEFETVLRQHLRTKTNHACPQTLKIRIQKIIELY